MRIRAYNKASRNRLEMCSRSRRTKLPQQSKQQRQPRDVFSESSLHLPPTIFIANHIFMATRNRALRGEDQKEFEGRIRKWERDWQAAGTGPKCKVLKFLKWVPRGEFAVACFSQNFLYRHNQRVAWTSFFRAIFETYFLVGIFF